MFRIDGIKFIKLDSSLSCLSVDTQSRNGNLKRNKSETCRGKSKKNGAIPGYQGHPDFQRKLIEDVNVTRTTKNRLHIFFENDTSNGFNRPQVLSHEEKSVDVSDFTRLENDNDSVLIASNKMRKNNLSVVHESYERYPIDKNIEEETYKRKLPCVVNANIMENRQETKIKLKNSVNNKPVISFFNDFVHPFNSTNNIGKSRGLTGKRSDSFLSNKKKESKLSTKKIGKKQSKSQCRYNSYTAFIRRIERENYDEPLDEKNAVFKMSSSTADETARNITEYSSSDSKAFSENHFLLEKKLDYLNEQLKSLGTTDSKNISSFNETSNNMSVEAYWNSSDHFRMVTRVFNRLPSSKKVFDEFLQYRKNKCTLKEEQRSDFLDKLSFEPTVEIQSDDKLTSVKYTHEEENVHETPETAKHDVFETTVVPSLPSFNKFCPDNINLIKFALVKEMSLKTKRTQDNEKFFQYFENSVREYVSKLLKEIREKDLNLNKNIEINKRINKNNKQLICKKVNKHIPKKINKIKNSNVDYNKALKQFEKTLLNSESECSLPHEKTNIMKKSDLKYCFRGKRNRNKSDSRRHSRSKKMKSSCVDSMKSRKEEVEQKLRHYSRQRSKSLNKKKTNDNNDIIRRIRHQKLKQKLCENKLTIPTKKEIQDTKRLFNVENEHKYSKQSCDNSNIVTEGETMTLDKSNEVLNHISDPTCTTKHEKRDNEYSQQDFTQICSQISTLDLTENNFLPRTPQKKNRFAIKKGKNIKRFMKTIMSETPSDKHLFQCQSREKKDEILKLKSKTENIPPWRKGKKH